MTQNIMRYRRTPGEFSIMIMGDHGMTKYGGHGGNSDLETLVPLIFIQQNVNLENNINTLFKRKNKFNKQLMAGINFYLLKNKNN